jgi:ribulose-5-phosphate 4-epimerase/fuculose-1-phosphate aldolase
MAPPTATETYVDVATKDNPMVPADGFREPNGQPNGTATHEPGLKQDGVSVQMQKFPSPPKFTDKYEEREFLKGRLALAFRIFGKLGFDEGVAGHITLRDPVDPHSFWVNPFGLAFSLIKKSDLILVNHDGVVVDGGPNRLLNTAAYMIHAAVHKARPDVLCAAHSHSIYGRSFCSLGRPIDIISQDSCAFYNDLAVYNSFKGVVLAKEEGDNIAKAIGNKKACLLQNHGLLTCGQTIEAAVFWFVSLEKCCHAQMMADAACAGRGGATIKIDDEDAEFTYKSVGTPRAGWFSALPQFDMMARECGDEYLK